MAVNVFFCDGQQCNKNYVQNPIKKLKIAISNHIHVHGAKENNFPGLPFGQAVTMMYYSLKVILTSFLPKVNRINNLLHTFQWRVKNEELFSGCNARTLQDYRYAKQSFENICLSTQLNQHCHPVTNLESSPSQAWPYWQNSTVYLNNLGISVYLMT